MIIFVDSNYLPFDPQKGVYTPISQPLASYNRKCYVRIENSQLPLIERIIMFVKNLFKTILTLGFSADARSLLRQAWYNKREFIILGPKIGSTEDSIIRPIFDRFIAHLHAMQTTEFSWFSEYIKISAELTRVNLTNKQLQSLPDSIGQLSALQSLGLGYNQLHSLPNSIGQLSALQYLHLHLNKLQSLPDSIRQLSALQNLNLGFNKFYSLPDSIGQLSALQLLNLGCNRLHSLPDSIAQLRNLRSLSLISNNISTIPPCIYELPSTCQVNLEGNPLSEESVQELLRITQDATYQGPRITFSAYANSEPSEPAAPQHVLAEWGAPEILLSDEQKSRLALWLSRLKETKDFQLQPNKVKAETKELLAWLATNPKEASIAHTIIKDATDSCGDRVALSRNDLAILKKMATTPSLSMEQLKTFIIGLERCEMLKAIAEKKCQSLRAVDPIEVHLCYQANLKKALDLPLEADSMLFQRYSGVTDDDLENARLLVLKKEPLEILVNNCVWQEAIKKLTDFQTVSQACDAAKAQSDLSEEQFEEYKINDNTIWNPCYVMTQKMLE